MGRFPPALRILSTLEPLLRASGNENELAGSFALDWEGNGDAQIVKNSGKLKLVLEKGRYGDLKSVQANIDASYSPEGLDVPIIFSRPITWIFRQSHRQRVRRWRSARFNSTRARRNLQPAMSRSRSCGEILGRAAPVVPSTGKVTATFQSENLDIRKVFEDVGLKPMASGTMNAKLDAKGTVADLNARLDVQMRDLRSEQWPHLEPATFDVTAEVVRDRLAIAGKLQQTRIQPLELTASMPFDIPKIVRARKLPDETPITAKARLPRSPVNFVRQFFPDLEALDGEAGLDVDVSGTIGNPILSGAGDMRINVARFTNPTLPALHNLNARLNFAGNTVTLEGFEGNLAGGPFQLSGRVTFPRLTEPTLDLQLKAESVLIARNDTLTARADADLNVTGPFLTATVTGNVAMTNSHFLKNIDLLPIGLPGRPAPEPPSSRPGIFPCQTRHFAIGTSMSQLKQKIRSSFAGTWPLAVRSPISS